MESRAILIPALVHPSALALTHFAGIVPSHLVQAACTGIHWNMEKRTNVIPYKILPAIIAYMILVNVHLRNIRT